MIKWKVAQTFIDKVDFKVKVATLELEIMITAFESHRKSLILHCGQTVLPDRSTLIGQKLVKVPKSK